jgi:hypothetical protein
VVHAMFGAQSKVARKVLDAYVHYGKTEWADLYGDILNDWSPQEEGWVQWWNMTTNWFNKNEAFRNVSIDSIVVAIRNTISSVYAYFIDSSSCLVQKSVVIRTYCWQLKMWWGNLLHKPSSEAVPTRDLFE